MGAAVAPAQFHDAGVHIACEVRAGAAMHLSPPLPVIAEEHGEAGNHQPHLIVVEVGACPRTKGRDALRLQGSEVRSAILLTHTMQEQRYLAIVGNDLALLQEGHQIGKAFRRVALMAAPDREDGRVVGVRSIGVGLNRLVIAKRQAARVRPVRRGHPAVICRDNAPVRAIVRGELDHGTPRNPRGELQDVTNRGAAEPV